jgi:signal transduction histidine kinase
MPSAWQIYRGNRTAPPGERVAHGARVAAETVPDPYDRRVDPGRDRSFEAPLWRALAVFRVAALAYALILVGHNAPSYRHGAAAWIVGAVMAVWTIVAIRLYRRPSRRRWPLLVADMVIMGGCLLVSVPIIGIGPIPSTRSLPGIAVAGPVLAWAISAGRRGGAVAAIVIAAADLWTRGIVNQSTLNSDILLVLAAIAIGHVARLGATAHEQLERATGMAAATRTRERLARDIHDSVLQVLSLVARRAQALGGEAADLGRLAGEQEAALRTLIGSSTPAAGPNGQVDVRVQLDRFGSATITIATPASPVTLPGRVAEELIAAVASALDNVAQHAGDGARAWVLLEDDLEAVTVTVRDDGAGFSAGALDRAAAVGRLGVAQSICGRLRDLGGRADIRSTPGEGTQIEMRVPRAVVRSGRPDTSRVAESAA